MWCVGWAPGPWPLAPAQAPRRLSAAAQPPALSPRGGRLHLRPSHPSPSQDGKTALDFAKTMEHTGAIKILEDPAAYLAAQVGHAAPHAAPQSLVRIYRLLVSAVPKDWFLRPANEHGGRVDPCCPAFTTAADRVWRRLRASAGPGHDGPAECG